MPFEYLTRAERRKLAELYFDAGFDYGRVRRRSLLDGLPPAWVRINLPIVDASEDLQFDTDLRQLNGIVRLEDGTVPLELFLDQLEYLFKGRLESAAIRAYRENVRRESAKHRSRANTEPEPFRTPELPSTPEVITDGIDDILPIRFFARGLECASSVARLVVPRYFDGFPEKNLGMPVTGLGTGWLIAPDLVLTNRHVIEARDLSYEDPAEHEDLLLQGCETEVWFDYESSESDTTAQRVRAVDVLAVDAALDYAVLRLEKAPGRTPLEIAPQRAKVSSALGSLGQKMPVYIPVNIIQHPGGGPKMVAFRNNYIFEAGPTYLHYLTDTRGGSSGSPVFNDNWEVVALHRASQELASPQLLGTLTISHVNEGVHLQEILSHLRVNFPKVHARIPLTD